MTEKQFVPCDEKARLWENAAQTSSDFWREENEMMQNPAYQGLGEFKDQWKKVESLRAEKDIAMREYFNHRMEHNC